MDRLGVVFVFDLNTASELGFREHSVLLEHLYGGSRQQGRDVALARRRDAFRVQDGEGQAAGVV